MAAMTANASTILNECLASNGVLAKGDGDALVPLSKESLEGKIVGLYFSAHWCPPCRRLTPLLAEKYAEIVGAGHQFEIIFVSADRSEAEAHEYFKTHPWKMLSFSSDEANGALNDMFEVSGIPHLVLLDENFQLLTQNGVEAIMSSDFSRIRTFEQDKAEKMNNAADIMESAVEKNVIMGKGVGGGPLVPVSRGDLSGKIIGLYFSAHWCPPCRRLTPILGEKYLEIVAAGHPFEIIFISADRQEDEALEYFKSHPWKMLSYDDQDDNGALNDLILTEFHRWCCSTRTSK
jgi:nucleoredoxin